MTSKHKLKRLVRAHARKTGLTYTAALRSFLAQKEETIEMTQTDIDLDQLLRSADEKARAAGLNWVGVEHVLLVLAESGDDSYVASIADDVVTAIHNRRPANEGKVTVEATNEFVRLAQLLTFARAFTPGGQLLSAPKIIQAIVQDNPNWEISALLQR